VAVVGGGIAGLAAAHHLAGGGTDVVVLEASSRAGGKLRTEPFAGVDLETAPDSFLARRPEAVELCRELGLADELVAPAETSAYVFARGRLRRLPGGTVLGVPTDPRALARSGVLSPAGVARAAIEPWLPGRPLAGDTTVGELVGRRFGRQTAARLVDPLVGGINAGHTDRLSVDVVAPQLAAAARRHRSLVRGLRAAPVAGGEAGPVFLTLPGGLSRLVDALVAAIGAAGGEVRLGAPVHALAGDGAGYLLDDGSPGGLAADRVVLAAPATVTAGLLAPTAPEASTILGAVAYASVALVTLAFAEDAVRRPLDASGFVVPRPEGLTMTGCTWADRKWAHLRRPGQVLVRASAGRVDNDDAALPDDELVGRLLADLATTMDLRDEPTAVAVHRWPASFPQYAPGHLDRMARARRIVRDALPGVALAGAALAGVGIPACIGTGRAAADEVATRGARP
jgi:oxygen-dependent protoporphyrinogen oxidase